jgi:RNA recognition motif-containing protein
VTKAHLEEIFGSFGALKDVFLPRSGPSMLIYQLIFAICCDIGIIHTFILLATSYIVTHYIMILYSMLHFMDSRVDLRNQQIAFLDFESPSDAEKAKDYLNGVFICNLLACLLFMLL